MKRYLAIPGVLLLTTAFVRAAVTVEWDTVGVALAALGAIVVVVTMVWNRREVVEWIRDPRGVFAVTTGIVVAAMVAGLVVLNIAVWYNPWSLDLTASGRNQVSEGTRILLQRLDDPVALRQFGRASDPAIEQLLQGFGRESRYVGVEFVDVNRDRDLAGRYGVVKLGTVVAVSGDKFRKVEDANEQALITAVLQVTAEVERTICFLTGHGERGLGDTGPEGLSELASTLEASNYRTERISLLEDEIPPLCGVLVVSGPRQELSAVEVARLQAFLAGHGRIALLLEPDPSPSLGEWLRPIGVVPGPGSVIDTSGAGQSVGGGPRVPLALRYVDHPVTRGFEIATMFPGVRPLEVIEAPELGGRPIALAQTGPRSFANTSAGPVPVFQEGRDTRGPLSLVVATSIGTPGRPEEDARLAVFGDTDFVSNAFLRRQGNRDFFLRSLAWLLGEEEATIVSVDDRENRRVELTEAMRAWMYIINLGVLPLVPLLAGVVVYVRTRRHPRTLAPSAPSAPSHP